MTTTEQKLTLAREALELAKNNHGVMLMSDPPQDAWKARGVDAAIRRALDAIATESAPAAGAASVDIPEPEFSAWFGTPSGSTEKKYGYSPDQMRAWGAQQREEGRAEGIEQTKREDTALILAERERAEKAESELEEWRFTNKIDELQRAHDVLLARAQTAEAALAQPAVDIERVRDLVREYAKVQMPMAREMVWNEIAGLLSQDKSVALAQRAAGDIAAKMPCGAAVSNVYEAYEAGKLAARAVGGVDILAALQYARDVIDTLSEKAHGKADRIYCMNVLKPGNVIDHALLVAAPAAPITGATPVVSAQAPVVAAPVGDGDERETLAAINKALAYLVKPSCVDAAIATLRSLRAALTQQKG